MINEVLKTEDYEIHYNSDNHEMIFYGSLRLSGAEEYQPIVDLLEGMMANQPALIILNLRKLDFLNSSGINMLSKFVITVRKRNTINVTVKGSKSIPWQTKSLKNLQRLMTNLSLEVE